MLGKLRVAWKGLSLSYPGKGAEMLHPLAMAHKELVRIPANCSTVVLETR